MLSAGHLFPDLNADLIVTTAWRGILPKSSCSFGASSLPRARRQRFSLLLRRANCSDKRLGSEAEPSCSEDVIESSANSHMRTPSCSHSNTSMELPPRRPEKALKTQPPFPASNLSQCRSEEVPRYHGIFQRTDGALRNVPPVHR